MDVKECVTFTDAVPGEYEEMASLYDNTRMSNSSEVSLANFFKRPILIQDIGWQPGSSIYSVFDPWTLYMSNPRVVNRMSNYALGRFKMKLKFIINGNGFYFSRLVASYLPFYNLDEAAVLAFSSDIANFTTESQRHKIYLNPTTSSGGEMELPFFWYKDNFNLTQGDWSKCGNIVLRSLEILQHANNSNINLSINVFAWLEDVELLAPTTINISGMTPQMGEMEEIVKEGAISGPATAVAAKVKTLTTIPKIGKYAMATSDVAEALAGMAKLFGLSRPVNTHQPERFRTVPISTLSLTTVGDTIERLTIDDKQELTIDPTIAGLADTSDPLTIRSIASIESYYHKFTWATANGPDTLLWTTRIDPHAHSRRGDGGICLTAIAAASLPFANWTGTIKYRFQIMCSAYHKGRLRIVYDPNYPAEDSFGHVEMNVVNSHVVDLSETNDFTVSIGPTQAVGLFNKYTFDSPITDLRNTVKFTTNAPGNGTLSVYVMNELTSPSNTSQTVYSNVYISAGDDFEVFYPTSSEIEHMVFQPQMDLVPDSFGDSHGTASSLPQSTELSPSQPRENLDKIYGGESIRSFRTLLKRYNLFRTFGNDSLTLQVHKIKMNSMPYLRGNVPGAIDTRDDLGVGTPYNYCNTTLLTYLTMGFQGWRGSIRHKLIPESPSASMTLLTQSSVIRTTDPVEGLPQYVDINQSLPSFISNSARAWYGVTDASSLSPFLGIEGMALTTATNPNLEFEVPFYSRLRFMPGKKLNRQGNTTSIEKIEPAFAARFDYLNNILTYWNHFVAVGEDFQVYSWSGMPPLYYEALPPPYF